MKKVIIKKDDGFYTKKTELDVTDILAVIVVVIMFGVGLVTSLLL